MPDIAIQHFSTVIGNSVLTADVSITLVGGDSSKAFIVQTASTPYCSMNWAVTANQVTRAYSAAVYFTSDTNIRLEKTQTIETYPHLVRFEVWEYLGADGGPNEFVVRAQSSVTIDTGNAKLEIDPWSGGDYTNITTFQNGILWSGSNAAGTETPRSGMANRPKACSFRPPKSTRSPPLWTNLASIISKVAGRVRIPPTANFSKKNLTLGQSSPPLA